MYKAWCARKSIFFVIGLFGFFVMVRHVRLTQTVQSLQLRLARIPGRISFLPTVHNYTIPKYKAQPLKKIMLYTGFFGSATWYDPHFHKDSQTTEISCANMRYRCVVTYNRSEPEKYDAIVFHSRNFKQGSPIPDQKKRRPNQVYIMHLWESPIHNGGSIPGDTFYNWSSTYSTSSDIVTPHRLMGKLAVRNENALNKLPQLQKKRPNGTAAVLWIVSHCNTPAKRHLYLDQLVKYMPVDVYGRCGKPCPKNTGGNSQACYDILRETGQYKFYLAWENSFCKDYISFKAFRALNSSFVPIVMGGLTAGEYKYLFPPNSYIDVRNFTNVKALADYLIYLDEHDEVYKAYHTWRIDHWVAAGFDLFCNICSALYNTTKVQQRKNVNWGAHWNARMCDNGAVHKLIGPPPTTPKPPPTTTTATTTTATTTLKPTTNKGFPWFF